MKKPAKFAAAAEPPFAAPDWIATRVEMRAVGELRPHPKNPNKHPDEQIDGLGGAMQKFGVTSAIVIDEKGTILAGEGRWDAARKKGMEQVPVFVARGWSEKKKIAFMLADNQWGKRSDIDEDVLRDHLLLLRDTDFEQFLGFSDAALAELLDVNSGETDPEETPELPKKPVVRAGELWNLRHHRLLCADASNAKDVARLLDGVTPDLANCDPPYGISIVKGASVGGAKPFGKSRGNGHSPGRDGFNRGRGHGPARRAIIAPGLYQPVIGDDTTDTAIAAYQTLIGLNVPIIVLWGGNYYANALPPSRCWLVWDKESSGSFSDAELAWTNQDRVVKLFRHQWNGLMKASERGQRRVHPTQKPVALAEWVIETIAPKAKTALDLFLGSGSTLIAAERRGLQFFGMELAAAYIEASIVRWQNLTGLIATREDGATLTDLTKRAPRKAPSSSRENRIHAAK